MLSIGSLRQQTRVAAATLVVVFLAALTVPAVAANARWIVPAGSALPTGSTVVGSFPVIDALVVDSPTAPVGGVSYETPLGFKAQEGAEEVELALDTGVAYTNAPAVWNAGEFGEQAVVAVVDTGVAPVKALEGAVAGEINFSGSPHGGDGYGHGTFIASLIAGHSSVAPGVAPEAGILSLKVADQHGNASLGSVISALQWLHSTGSGAGIRIATLALGVDPADDGAPLLEAASNAVADTGVLVVTASGNDGPNNLTSPATATGTYSVGSVEYVDHDNSPETAPVPEDASYSGTGPDRDGVMQPDGKASGTSVIGSMPLNSVIGTTNPTAYVGGDDPELFRGTGTSMSTALVAGVAALASSARPDLTGDQLAAALGTGVVDAATAVENALDMPAGENVDTPPWVDVEASPGKSGGKGKADGRGSMNGKGKGPEVTPNGLRWVGLRWAGLRWVGLRWADGQWTGLRWVGLRWVGLRWADGEWTGLRWVGLRWAGLRWVGLRWADSEWAGLRWAGLRWTGLRWAGLRWVGLRWAGDHWGDETWAFGKWAGLRWAGSGWEGTMTEPTFEGLRWAGLRWAGDDWAGLRWAGLRWAGLRWAGLRWAMLDAPDA